MSSCAAALPLLARMSYFANIACHSTVPNKTSWRTFQGAQGLNLRSKRRQVHWLLVRNFRTFSRRSSAAPTSRRCLQYATTILHSTSCRTRCLSSPRNTRNVRLRNSRFCSSAYCKTRYAISTGAKKSARCGQRRFRRCSAQKVRTSTIRSKLWRCKANRSTWNRRLTNWRVRKFLD
jgi:hypothetical protein